MAVPMGSAARVLLEVGNIAQLRFGWQAWHFVTVRRVPYCNVSKVVLCDRRNTFASLSDGRVACFLRIPVQGCVKWCKRECHFAWQGQYSA